MQLRQVPHIKLNVEIEFNRKITDNDLNNYFRMFKNTEESLESDCIYSPFFDVDIPYTLGDDYTGRMNLYNCLREKLYKQCTSLYIFYDFTYAPINTAYFTNEEFIYMGKVLEEALVQTDLSLLLLVSHFKQFANKKGTLLKPEHFHALIGNPEKSEIDLDFAVNQFIQNLYRNPLINNIKIKE